jgi:hypothetical protein
MTGHHISEHARLKILRPVLKKMYAHAVSVILGEWFVSRLLVLVYSSFLIDL